MATGSASHRLEAVEIDEASMAHASREGEHERRVAIADLLEHNSFEPQGSPGGPYVLKLAMTDGRLAFDIVGPDGRRRHLLSLTPLKGVIKDYMMICGSYDAAIRDAAPAQIEAIDMGRRGIHNDGAERLRERLAGKVTLDLDTARRLFTLICAIVHRTPA
jgi:uncharacterized protein (UPF0262 family)